ncbi:MAG TPA: hypothetical protein VGM37_06770 [Armatimonadota bacterium]|jgi:hypothetical protein
MATQGNARRRLVPAAFWLDWAPIILLGLTAALCAVWSLGDSVVAGRPQPAAAMETRQLVPRENTARVPAPPARTTGAY